MRNLWGGGYVTPNVCYIEETNGIVMKSYVPVVKLITFTIDGIEYQAEEGMTWNELFDSKYNPIMIMDGYEYKVFSNGGDMVLYQMNSFFKAITINGIFQKPSDKIINTIYTLQKFY